MNSAIKSGLLLFAAMVTVTPTNHRYNFAQNAQGKKNVQAYAAADEAAVESKKAARAANATENIQADEGEGEAKDEDEIWTNLWTALEALKPPQPKPLYCPEPKPLYCPEPKPLKKLMPTGTVGASSNFNAKHNQDNAFTQVKEPKWCSGIRKWPASIWMRFDEPHRLGKISFESQYELNLILEVIGSPDCDKNNWTTLLTVDYPALEPFVAKSYLIPSTYPVLESTFSCLGLRFSIRNKRDGPDLDWMCINRIQMWEYL